MEMRHRIKAHSSAALYAIDTLITFELPKSHLASDGQSVKKSLRLIHMTAPPALT